MPVDGPTLMSMWTVLIRLSVLLKIHKKRQEVQRVWRVGLGEVGGRMGLEYDQNIFMYEIIKELIKYLF